MAYNDNLQGPPAEHCAALCKTFAPKHSLAPQLSPWFAAVNQYATQFSIQAGPWQDLAAVGFPDPILGSLPVTIVDENTFSPLQDMRHSLGWPLNCDHVLCMSKPVDRSYFATYLQHGSEAIKDTTIYGGAVPGGFRPNFVDHSSVHNGWPTQNNVLGDFGLPVNVLLVARKYSCSCLSLYDDHTRLLPVIWTRDHEQYISTHGDHTPLAQAHQRDIAHPPVPFIGKAQSQ
jgi:hypothetical protein